MKKVMIKADGVWEVAVKDGKYVPVRLVPPPYGATFSKKIKQKHREALVDFFYRSLKLAKNRDIPFTTEECERMGFDKKMMKELERFGLVEGHMVHLKNAVGMNVGGRKVFVVSPLGRAMIEQDTLVAISGQQEADKIIQGVKEDGPELAEVLPEE